MIKMIKGDLIALAKAGEFDTVVHGCNCFCTMGAGIAKQIAAHFPEAAVADRLTAKADRTKIGSCSIGYHTVPGHTIVIVNAYTQFHYDGDGVEDLVDYEGVRSCLRWICRDFGSTRIGIPLIGAGLARGNWSRIERIILDELGRHDVTIVHYSE